MQYQDKTVWITGASSGVGEGLARVFHREGANLIISARRADELERVKAECTDGPGTIDVVAFDLVDEAARDAAIYPTPSDSELQTIFNNSLLKNEATGTVSLNVSHGTTGSGTKYVNLNASYSIPISLVLVDMGSIPASASRRIYVQD